MEKINHKIVLFEDRAERRSDFENGFAKVSSDVELICFDETDVERLNKIISDKTDTEESVAAEEHIAAYVRDNYGDATLLLVDHDITGLASSINEPAVTAAGRILNIPVCRYHRAPVSGASVSAKLKLWKSLGSIYAIELDYDDNIYQSAVEVSDGFFKIRCLYQKLGSEIRRKGPAVALAHILDKPGVYMRFSMYTNAVSIFNDIINTDHDELQADAKLPSVEDRVPFVLGYWLYNVILRYPCVILNEVATRSYLNVGNFEDDQIKSAFTDAKYSGPFEGIKEYWWRDKLDDLLDNYENVEDYLTETGVSATVEICRCSKDNTKIAGYYDVLTEQPISFECSKGGMSWMPQGADLSRIEIDEYDKLAPLINY